LFIVVILHSLSSLTQLSYILSYRSAVVP